MSKPNELRAIRALHAKAPKALKEAVGKAILQHQLAGVPAAVWRNGRVVYLTAKSPGRKQNRK